MYRYIGKDIEVTCDYCGNEAELVEGRKIYPENNNVAKRLYWRCVPCDAYVGTHAASKQNKPFGRLANPELRKAKIGAHAAFDRLWKFGYMTRTHAYVWLAKSMGITLHRCHIGNFTVEQCNQVKELANQYLRDSIVDSLVSAK